MAEKIVSPGVFTNEIDASFLPAAVADIGAVVVGPTVKGPALTPTVVTSMAEYEQIFGTTFSSGSGTEEDDYTFLTSQTAKNYLQHSNQLTVVRILAGSFSGASANVVTGSGNQHTGSATSGHPATVGTNVAFKLHTLDDGTILNNTGSLFATAIDAIDTTGAGGNDSVFTINVPTANGGEGGAVTITLDGDQTTAPVGEGANALAIGVDSVTDANTAALIIKAINGTADDNIDFATSGRGMTGVKGITAKQGSDTVHITLSMDTIKGTAGNITSVLADGSGVDVVDVTAFTGGVEPVGSNGILVSGSKDSYRYEITSVNPTRGTFGLAIRRGNDTHKMKQTLETYNNLSLDPKSSNYIAKAVGDQYNSIGTDENGNPFLKLNGTNKNMSKYVRVEVINTTPDYIDENGNLRIGSFTGSLPGLGSGSDGGSFTGGSDGTVTHPMTFNENISENSSQGLDPSTDGGAAGYDDYITALKLLNNADEYDFNLLLMPGIIESMHGGVVTKAIDICEDRGDCFVVIDPVPHGSNPPAATTRAEARNTSYGAMYWPWIKVPDNQLGKDVWVPPSVSVAGVYAFNDKVAHEWFAPAGLNRGTIDTAKRAERKLTQSNRDLMYDANLNPIASFPGQGVTIFGQKTLQKKASALDRVNVRRLLIRVKKFIASSSRFLLFEQNTAATRRRFLDMANPFLEQIQSQSGLNAFRVVMDETNNTPDTIDRNFLVGQLFLQPTRTAEFIVLDFTIQRSGATFPE